MNVSKYELVIVGAGVVGMGAALAASKQGIKKILIVDRHHACTGASIRNFGFITITKKKNFMSYLLLQKKKKKKTR